MLGQIGDLVMLEELLEKIMGELLIILILSAVLMFLLKMLVD